MTVSDFLQIRAGLTNYFSAYSAAIMPTVTSIEQQSLTKFGGGAWQFLEDYDIIVSAKRLARDNVDLELGNVERELQRIICNYKQDDIPGVDAMFYLGDERIYDIDNYAKSNWMARIMIRIRYMMVNEAPY